MAREPYSRHELAYEVALLGLAKAVNKLTRVVDDLSYSYHTRKGGELTPEDQEELKRNRQMVAEIKRDVERALEPLLRDADA